MTSGEAMIDLLAILFQSGAISEDDYCKAAHMLEETAMKAAPIGGPSSVVDRRIDRHRIFYPYTDR